MAAPLQLAMVFKAETAQAKAALADLKGGMAQVSAEARGVKTIAQEQAAALDRGTASALKVAAAQADLGAAVRAAAGAAMTAATGFSGSVGSINSFSAATKGVASSISAASREAVGAAQDARAYRAALDDIRASYNPLFAASRQYEQQLERIADDERLGAINALEAAAARKKAAELLAPIGAAPGKAPAGAGNSFITANLAAQGNDIFMMAAAGQNPLQLALQQGTQVSQVLNGLEKGTSIPKALAAGFMSMVNPVSMATIGIIALGAFGLQALSKLIPPTKTVAEAMDSLAAKVDAYKSSLDRLRSNDLARDFGSASIAAQGLIRDIADLQRAQTLLGAGQAMGSLADEMRGGSWRGFHAPSDQFRDLSALFGERGNLYNQDRSPLARDLWAQFADWDKMPATADIDDRVAALERVKGMLERGRSAQGADQKGIAARLMEVNAQLLKLREFQGLEENAAGKAAADALVGDLQRQADLQAKIATFGRDSAEARALELQHARQNTAEKLTAQGIDAASQQWTDAMRAIDADFAARAQAERDARQRGHDDQVAALGRERQLLGATAAERAKITALAEAELEIRDRSLAGSAAELVRVQALAVAMGDVALQRDRALRDLQTGQMTDTFAAQIGLARDPLTQAELEAQSEYTRLIRDGADADIAAGQAARVRARGVTDAMNASRLQAADLMDEIAVRQQVAAQVAAGTVPAAEANRLIQEELQLRPLVAAAARAEGAEKQRLTEVITGLRLAYEMQAAEERRQAQNDALRGAAERTQQLRLELALVGQSATLRARVLALVQAEQDIRRLGLDASSEAAAELRRGAAEAAEMARVIDTQADAWQRVQSAGESALDAVLDKLKGGDVKRALAGMLDELNKGFFDLAVRNPLKNRIFGSNLGTLDDIGGMQGIWGRLTGQAPLDEKGLVASASQQVQAMTIAAAQVTINAASIGGNALGLLGMPGAGLGPANTNAAPQVVGQEARTILSAVGIGGGARTDAISHLDQALAEPLAAMVAEAQRLFGESAVKITSAYRSPGRQAQLWEEALAKYGSPEAARKWVAPPGRSNHNRGLAADLRYGSPQVQDWFQANAPAYGLGYRMRHEPWHIEPVGGARGRGADRQVTGGAEQAMATFGANVQVAAQAAGQMGQAAQKATGQVGEMGQGMGQFGGALAQLVGGAVNGGKGGLLGAIVGLGGQWLQGKLPAVPGFATGGPTGGSDPSRVAGVVHEQEYVFSAAAVRRIGAANLDALHQGSLRGFRSGGYVSALPMPAAASSGEGRTGGAITFAPSFDLRGANDPAEVEKAARRGMAQAMEEYDRALPGRFRELQADPRVR